MEPNQQTINDLEFFIEGLIIAAERASNLGEDASAKALNAMIKKHNTQGVKLKEQKALIDQAAEKQSTAE